MGNCNWCSSFSVIGLANSLQKIVCFNVLRRRTIVIGWKVDYLWSYGTTLYCGLLICFWGEKKKKKFAHHEFNIFAFWRNSLLLALNVKSSFCDWNFKVKFGLDSVYSILGVYFWKLDLPQKQNYDKLTSVI